MNAFDLEKRIVHWRNEMSRAGLRPEVLDELESHLREELGQLQSTQLNAAAFEAAAKRLGDSTKLKDEFSKLNRLSDCWNRNPLMLNLLAVCFVISGLNWLACGLRSFIADDRSAIDLAQTTLFATQIAVGIGLLRGINFWRYPALAFGALHTLIFALLLAVLSFAGLGLLLSRMGYPIHPLFDPNENGMEFGIMLPLRINAVIDLFQAFTISFSLVYLSRRSVRRLFGIRPKIATN